MVNAPGEAYSYSTFGFTLLSAVLESAAKKDFLKILDEEVFQPLEMKNSGPDIALQIIPGRTRFYERSNGVVLIAPFEDTSYKWAGGGILSSAADLVRFGFAHLTGNYLKDSTRNLLYTSQRTKDGKETGIGIAWRIGKDPYGRTIYHHAGSQNGSRAFLMLYPEHNLVISILSNLSGEPAMIDRTGQVLADFFLTKRAPADQLKSGSYLLTGKYEEKEFSAEMQILENRTGTISETFPVAATALKNKLSPKLVITDTVKDNENVVLVVATAFGLLDFVLTPEGEGYAGKLNAGPAKIDFHVQKK